MKPYNMYPTYLFFSFLVRKNKFPRPRVFKHLKFNHILLVYNAVLLVIIGNFMTLLVYQITLCL